MSSSSTTTTGKAAHRYAMRVGNAEDMEIQKSNRKLKVAFVLDRFLPSRGGERYFEGLANELSRAGHDVHFFAMAAEKCPEAAYQVHLIPVWRFPRSLRILTFLLQSARLVKQDEFDIIHGVGWTLTMNVFNPHGGVEQAYLKQEFRSITSRPYYVWKYLKRYLSLEHYLILWIQRRQYLSPKVKKIIAISQMIKKDIIQRYGTLAEKIVVVFNSVDLDRFHPRNRELYRKQKRDSLTIPLDTTVLFFVGNNYRLKGLESLMRALGFLRQRFGNHPFLLLVAGRGQVGRYRRKAQRLGVSDLVRFLGPVGEVEQYYAASDIYVHPTFYDSCSLTVLEALASGLPVVTTRFNGAADAILSQEGGRVVEDPACTEDLAEAIATFFDETRRERARVVTREWMERYPSSYNVRQTLQVYDEVAGALPTKPPP
jgi:UDP-glucose:(heptosyl)LPS alpha-1,3-glucosyltransferase